MLKVFTAAAMLSLTVFASAANAGQVVHVGLIDASDVKGANITGGNMLKHEMMTVRSDVAEVKAGMIEFDATNYSHAFPHEMIVLAVKDAAATLPYNKGASRVDEDKLSSMGEVSEMGPGKSGTLTVNLPPGKYLLICNVASHFMAGMSTPLTVVQ